MATVNPSPVPQAAPTPTGSGLDFDAPLNTAAEAPAKPVVAPGPAPAPVAASEPTYVPPAVPKPVPVARDAAPLKEVTQSVTANSIDPAALAALKFQQAKEADVMRAQGAIEAQASLADTELKQLQGAELARIQDEYNVKIKDRQADLDADIQAIKSTPIDSGRVWKNASTGDKLLAGIALLASSAAQAMGDKGPNAGLNYIQRTIDQDIDAQKFDLLAKKDLIQEKRSMLSTLIADRGYTVDQAAEAMKAGRYAAASEQFKVAADKATALNNAAVANKYNAAAEAMATRAAEKMAELSTRRTQTETKDVRAAAGPDNYLKQLPDEGTRKEVTGALGAVDSSARMYKYLKENPEASRGFGIASKKLIDLKAALGALGPDERKDYSRIQGEIANTARAVLGPGVLTEQDIAFATQIAPNMGNDYKTNLAVVKDSYQVARERAESLFRRNESFGIPTPEATRQLVNSYNLDGDGKPTAGSIPLGKK